MEQKKSNPQKILRILLPVLLGVAILILGLLAVYILRPAHPEQKLPDAAPNTYRLEAFYMEDGFLRYRDAPHRVGVDVSAHQGEIDWEAVAGAGVDFAIIRAGFRGSTEGGLYEDEYFRANVEGAQAAGLKVGAYFFSQARNGPEAKEEALYACSLLEGITLDLPLFYDWETVEGSTRIPSPEGIDMTECALYFCRTAEGEGLPAGVYFNQTYGYLHLQLEELQGYTLWLAEYDEQPTFAYAFDCVQYTDKGEVPGIQVPVDLNLFIINE